MVKPITSSLPNHVNDAVERLLHVISKQTIPNLGIELANFATPARLDKGIETFQGSQNIPGIQAPKTRDFDV